MLPSEGERGKTLQPKTKRQKSAVHALISFCGTALCALLKMAHTGDNAAIDLNLVRSHCLKFMTAGKTSENLEQKGPFQTET